MKMTKLFLLLASVGALAISSDRAAAAGSAPANLTVQATVVANCSIKTTAVSFVGYDPLNANATAPLNAQGSVIIACTKGATTHIGLDTGKNPGGSTGRQMVGGSPVSQLPYSLSKTSSGGDPWGNADPTWLATPAPSDMTPISYPIYGQIPPAQNVSPGTDYVDTVVATVNF